MLQQYFSFAVCLAVLLSLCSLASGQPISLSSTVAAASTISDLIQQRILSEAGSRDAIVNSYANARSTGMSVDGSAQSASFGAAILTELSTKIQALENLRNALISVDSLRANVPTPSYVNSDTVTVSNNPLWKLPVNNLTSAVTIPLRARNASGVLTAAAARDVHASASLEAKFIENQNSDPSIRYQFFGGKSGIQRVYPALQTNESETNSSKADAALRPWYTAASVGHRSVVILLDAHTTHQFEDLRAGVVAYLRSLSSFDFVQLITSAPRNDCLVNVTTLMRATPATIEILAGSVESMSPSARSLNHRAAVTKAYSMLSNVTVRTCVSVIAYFSNSRIKDEGLRDYVVNVIQSNPTSYVAGPSVRIMGYSVGSDGDRFELRRLACSTGGMILESDDKTSIVTLLPLADAHLQRAAPQQLSEWMVGFGHQPHLGEGPMISIVVVVVKNSSDVVGVVGVDFVLSSLIHVVLGESYDRSYGFITNEYGDAVVHPQMLTINGDFPPDDSDSSIYSVSNYEPDSAQIEAELIPRIQNSSAGSWNNNMTNVNRLLPFGGSDLPANLTYFWETITASTLVVVRVQANGDENQFNYEPAGATPLDFYHRLDLLPPSLNPGYSYSNATDYDVPISNDTSSVFWPDIRFIDPRLPIVVSPTQSSIADLHRYYNQLGAVTNPGVQPLAASESKLTASVSNAWRQSYFTSRNPGSNNGRLPPILFQSWTSANNLRRTFPSRMFESDFLPSTAVDYVVGVGSRGTPSLSPPFYATTAAGSALTIAFRYDEFRNFTLLPLGCAITSQASPGAPRCFLIDSSGLVLVGTNLPSSLSSATSNTVNQVALADLEPDLAGALSISGVMKSRDFFTTVSGITPGNITRYVVDTNALTNGTYSGAVTGLCIQSGNYFLAEVSGTNTFFLALSNYNESSSCPPTTPTVPKASVFNCPVAANRIYGAAVWAVDCPPLRVRSQPAQLEICETVPIVINSLKLSNSGNAALVVISGAGILVLFAFGILFLFHLSAPVIVSSNPLFLYISMLGIFIAYLLPFLTLIHTSDTTCRMLPLVAGLAFMFTCVPMLVKLIYWRRIYKKTSLLSVPISNRDLVVYCSVFIGIEIFLLLLWSFIDPMRLAILKDTLGNTWSRTCEARHVKFGFLAVQVVYVVIVALAGIVLSWSISKIHSYISWAESRYIGFGMANVAMWIVLMGVLILSLSAYIATFALVICLCFMGMATGVMFLLCAPKAYVLIFRAQSQQQGGAGVQASARWDVETQFKPDNDIDQLGNRAMRQRGSDGFAMPVEKPANASGGSGGSALHPPGGSAGKEPRKDTNPSGNDNLWD